ncbi:GNAT family N-acetyltransferase [candidate division KSB1 bacterium]|nr:GNAT family N-acetyltransferase [candidate division KSB1 bacterium]
MTYQIELAQAKYISDLHKIDRAAAEIFPLEDLPMANRLQTTPLKTFEQAQQENRLWLLINNESDQVVGFALCSEFKNQMHLKEIDVHPEHGHQGLGNAIVQDILYKSINHSFHPHQKPLFYTVININMTM